MAAGRTDIRVSSVREDSHGLAGGPRLERAVDAAHALSDLLWEEVHEQLGSAHAREDRARVDGDARRHSAQLAERIADLASTVALLASGDGCATAPPGPRARSAPHVSPPAGPASGPRSSAVLIDERDELSADQLWAPRTRRSDDRVEDIPRALELPWLGLIERGLAEFERDCEPFAEVTEPV